MVSWMTEPLPRDYPTLEDLQEATTWSSYTLPYRDTVCRTLLHSKTTSICRSWKSRTTRFREVDLSFNNIETLNDFTELSTITKLIVDNNKISSLDGLQECKSLSCLSVAHNRIEKIENLQGLPLKYLNLRGNRLKEIENVESLHHLQQLDLSGNFIGSLRGLETNTLLETIDLENNHVESIDNIKPVQEISLLRNLNLLRNPIQGVSDYRLSLLYCLPQLTELDRHRVEAEEKVSANNMFNAPMDVVAAEDHRRCMVYASLRSARIYDSTLPSMETPYPMLVLVGPPGSGKNELAHKLVAEFPTYFGYGISHTTRAPYTGELDKKDFQFVSSSTFDSKIKQGVFLLTYQSDGHRYGVSQEAIEEVAKEGLACILTMEVEGVLSLKLTYYEPRYILLLPLDQAAHEARLRAVGNLSQENIEQALRETGRYRDIHQDKPGFFDMTVDSSDTTIAFDRCRELVSGYLGLEDSETQNLTTSNWVPSSNSPSPTQARSDSQTPMGDRSVTPLRSTSGMKTWSDRVKSGDTSSQMSRKLMSPAMRAMLEPTRSSVEQASYERRKSAARAAAAGIEPKPLDQLIARPPGTAPETLLGKGLDGSTARPKTGPAGYFEAPSPDSSAASRSGSELSGLSEARGMSGNVSPDSTASQQLQVSLNEMTLPGYGTDDGVGGRSEGSLVMSTDR
ncbi:leucine-rich repeat and guanylate kinase domain-containing protein-like isoform X2 [Acanthaster planci]|uniref:Leucine-rich repeat and guanylate kinase domain-containing protein-like isoform X2 n=1 Tax=Acanthaster planci TaxID=133434 RepID=A0A8B7Z1V4_ACAPL|nr:leucine-rich repeat and guanylate kinase domain-containing protein-like isoform X2 [Acanthaster planci]